MKTRFYKRELKRLKGLIKLLSVMFAIVAFLLVAIVAIANRLLFLIIIKRSILAAIFFGVFGGLIGYLVMKSTTSDNLKNKDIANQNQGQQEVKPKQQMNSVSQQTAAQQYNQQNRDIEDEEREDNFQPLNLEEVDYQELEEVNELEEEELTGQDPEQLAQMIKNMKDT